MANRPYLLNTPFLTSDHALLLEQLAGPGQDFLEVDGPGYRIPIPWLCCFRPGDLKRVVIAGEDMDLPSTSLSQAIRNLEASLPLFEQITGETQLAQRYWSEALAWLRQLPLPCLALDPAEILTMMDPESSQQDLVRALAGDASAIPYLKDFAGYEDGAMPYAPDVLRHVPGPYHDQRRTDNALALDVCAGAEMWQRAAGSPLAGDMRDTSYSVPEQAGPRDLGTVQGHIKVLLKGRDPDAWVIYGFVPQEPGRRECLKLLLCTGTDARRDALLRETRVRSLLDGPIADELRVLCAGHGFEWLGFVIESRDTLQRRLADINQWATLAPTPALA